MSELSVNDMVLKYREARESKDPDHRKQLHFLRIAAYAEIKGYSEQPPNVASLPEWQDAALCSAFPEVMFPGQGEKVIADLAKEACKACVARPQCKEFAIANTGNKQPAQYGIWGGLSERERRKIVRENKNKVTKAQIASDTESDGEEAA